MKYCEFCGTELKSNEKCSCPEAQDQRALRKPKTNKIVTFGVIVLIVAVLAVVCIFAALGTTLKADPFDYTTVTFEGYNTCGKPVIGFNEDEFISKFVGDEPTSFEEILVWSTEYDSYSSGISYSYSPKENLKNGDRVTVTFTVSDSISDKIKAGSKEFIVSGLTEVETIDLFTDIDVKFEGVAGSAKALVVKKSDAELLQNCNFVISPEFDLNGGDKVTVTISNTDELAQKYQVVPAVNSKEYTVYDLPEYVTSADQIPIDQIETIYKRFVDEQNNSITDDWMFSYSDVQYYGTYFLYSNEASSFAETNRLEVFVYYNEFLDGELRRTIYTPLVFTRILIYPDGTVDLEYENGSNTTFTTDIDAHFDDLKEDYIITKVE